MIIFTGDLFLGNSKIKIEKELLTLFDNSKYLISNFESVMENDNFLKREDKAAILQFKKNSFENSILLKIH